MTDRITFDRELDDHMTSIVRDLARTDAWSPHEVFELVQSARELLAWRRRTEDALMVAGTARLVVDSAMALVNNDGDLDVPLDQLRKLIHWCPPRLHAAAIREAERRLLDLPLWVYPQPRLTTPVAA